MGVQDKLQFPEVVVVEASAGSGKTLALAQRYLQLIINPALKMEEIPLRNILAITFTNKATIEMKERILELLKKIALDAFLDREEEKYILGMLGLDKEFAKNKASLVMDELIKHYNFFQVQTIDSFINALLWGCALRVDRSANFKIKTDYTNHLSRCIDLVIEQAHEESAVLELLEDFLQHYLFVENRTSWFPRRDILELMQSLFRLSNIFGFPFGIYKGRPQDLIKKKKFIFKEIAELASEFPKGINSNAKKSIDAFIAKGKGIFNIADLPPALRKPETPMNRGKNPSSDFGKRWERLHKDLKELIEFDAMVAYNPYVKLFERLLGFFQMASKKDDVLFLEELNQKARLLFSDEGLTVAEVYWRLATRFKHYLIDEFQDTSVLQWRNLEMMVEEALSSGGSLFYVGDKKQAIYRFRGGQSQLFDEVKEGFARFGVKSAHLIKNWRSTKKIVEFNNRIFSKANLERALSLSGIAKELSCIKDAIFEIAEVFRDAVQQVNPNNVGGYVRVERIEEKSRDERNRIMQPKITELIRELKKRFRYEDIAILARDNNEVELITSWLLEAGFPVESEKTLNVIQNSLIKEIVSFLRFLASPIDDLSFAAFILGDIFRKAANITQEEVVDFIFRLHKAKRDKTTPLYKLFRQKYPRIWKEYIDEFFKNVGFVSFYELTIAIYERYCVSDNFREGQAFFMKFLELAKVKESEYVGLEDFLNYLETASQDELYVNVTHSDSVKVITIHKAKGLEFPVVILPFLRMDINPETADKDLNSYAIERAGGDLGLMRITKSHLPFSINLRKIYAQGYKKACIDELNNIYVALTRAKFELYVYIPKRSGTGTNKVISFIPENLKEAGSIRPYQTEERKAQPLINIAPSKYKDWLRFLSDEVQGAQIKNRERIIQGNIFHAILSQIGNCTDQDTEKLLSRAIKYAQTQYPFVSDFGGYKTKVAELLKEPKLQSVFFVGEDEVFCEKEVVNRFGDLKRIDRLIVKRSKIILVDYKSSEDDAESHRKQMKDYIQIIKDIYPGRKIEAYLIYLDKLNIDKIPYNGR